MSQAYKWYATQATRNSLHAHVSAWRAANGVGGVSVVNPDAELENTARGMDRGSFGAWVRANGAQGRCSKLVGEVARVAKVKTDAPAKVDNRTLVNIEGKVYALVLVK